MENNFTKFFLFTIFILISINANAQYFDNNLIDDVPVFIAKSIANKNIRDKDAEVLRTNKVNQVRIKNEDGKIVAKLLINNFGYLEDYTTYNELTEAAESNWRFGFDVNNNMTSAAVKEGRLRINYVLTYENNLLQSVHIDSAGIEKQYDAAHLPDGKIMKITLLEFQTYTQLDVNYFNYDPDGRLTSLTDTNQSVIYSFGYGENSVTLGKSGVFYDVWQCTNDRITEEKYTFYSEPNISGSKKIDVMNFTEKYSYDEKNLVKEVKLKSSKTSESKETYEYFFISKKF